MENYWGFSILSKIEEWCLKSSKFLQFACLFACKMYALMFTKAALKNEFKGLIWTISLDTISFIAPRHKPMRLLQHLFIFYYNYYFGTNGKKILILQHLSGRSLKLTIKEFKASIMTISHCPCKLFFLTPSTSLFHWPCMLVCMLYALIGTITLVCMFRELKLLLECVCQGRIVLLVMYLGGIYKWRTLFVSINQLGVCTAHPKFFLFLWRIHFDWPITQIFLKRSWHSPKNRSTPVFLFGPPLQYLFCFTTSN